MGMTASEHAMKSMLAFNAGLAKGQRELRLNKAVAAATELIMREAEYAEGDGKLACWEMREIARELELAYAESKR